MVVLLPYLSMKRKGMRKKNQRVSSFHSFGILLLFFSPSPSVARFPLPPLLYIIFFRILSKMLDIKDSMSVLFPPIFSFFCLYIYIFFSLSLYNVRKGNVNTEEKKKNDEVINKLSSSLTSVVFFLSLD